MMMTSNLLELIQMRLESEDYQVVATAEEEEALEVAKEQTFDLSIIDLQLTNRNGISLMEDVHQINPICLSLYSPLLEVLKVLWKL